MLKLAMNQGVLFSASTAQFLELSSTYGLKAVELRAPKLKEWLYEVSSRKAKRVLADCGISVIAVNSLDDFSLVPDENLSLLEKETEWIGQMCEMVSCPLVIAPVGRWFDVRIPPEKVRDMSARRLELLNRVLSRYGVSVGVEPISFPEFSIQSIKEADDLCASSGNPANGLIVDYYNLFQGGMQPSDFSCLASPVHLVHINDAEFLPKDKLDVVENRAFPGEGSLDALTWTIEALRSGYDGYFSLEIFSKALWALEPADGMYTAMHKLNRFAEAVEREWNKE